MPDETFAARLLARAEATKDPRKIYEAEGVVRLGSRWQLLLNVEEAERVADALMALTAAAADGESTVRSDYEGTRGYAKKMEVYELARECLADLNRLP